ncbi:MAG TPA: hypothetical protein VHN74_17050 [Candidatus Angelobacter sp.]|nr:hypothetical protein [Candidatus Angelobacter sp.]
MEQGAFSILSRWENFYVIVGSSAGALTGLQFVVMALISDLEMYPSMLEVRAFATPTIVHFCAALLVSAVATAPWNSLAAAGIAFAVLGSAGLAYSARVIRHAKIQTGYSPDREDWFWYAVMPVCAYSLLLVGGIRVAAHPTDALFVIAGTTILLLINGIHNSWDSITYVAVHLRAEEKQKKSG